MNKAVLLVIIAATSTHVSGLGNNTWYIEQKIPPPQTATHPSGWGIPIGISGDTCVMGAHIDKENGFYAGAVYVYRFDGSEWVAEQKLMALDGQDEDYFGYGAAISDGTIIIGAPGDDDNGEDSGSVYVFRHNGTEWEQTQKLMPAIREHDNVFGTYVSISGNLCVIGADFWDVDVPCQVYVFRFDGNTWNEETSFTFSWADVYPFWGKLGVVYPPPYFGAEFVVGAPGDDEAGEDVGAVYLFYDRWDEWSMYKKIMPPDAEDRLFFGESIGYSGEVIAVSAPGDGGQNGCIYMYRPWIDRYYYSSDLQPEQKLTVPQQDKDKVFGFGNCLAVDGDTLITTAFKFIQGDPWPYYYNGIVYIYEYNGAGWALKSRFEASDSRQDISMFWQLFDWPVAIDGDVAMLGAQGIPGPGMTYIYRRCPAADVTGDCFVDMTDIGVLARQWLNGFEPWSPW